jgi:hypothetical protein
MFLKTLACILALVVIAEGGYIFWHRQPINRFKPMDDDGYVAFDTASGQLCRTFRANSAPKKIAPSPSSDRSPKTKSGDAILDCVRNGEPSAQPERDSTVEFILKLPTCRDIR